MKKLLSILLALALVVGLVPLAAAAEGATPAHEHTGWTVIDNDDELLAVPESGKYYLGGSLELDKEWTIGEGKNITLCLNGHHWKSFRQRRKYGYIRNLQ